MIRKLVSPNKPRSFSNGLRRRRFELFKAMIAQMPNLPIRILDVGGTQIFWENMDFTRDDAKNKFEITLLNIEPIPVSHPNFKSVLGDARNMPEFRDNEFDIVFSNSVIEHVGDFNDQKRMADELRRVGKYYFIQTPNYYFPVEPHFLFPLFQFLPIAVRAILINEFNLGNTRRIPNKQEALKYVKSLQLLSQNQLKSLFPDAVINKEKLFGLTKSFMCIRD
jgi:hypothetical protein